MPSYWDKEKGYSYYRSDSRFNPYSHGSYENALEHKEEMERIANDIADKKLNEAIPKIYQQAYADAYEKFSQAFDIDVESIVKVGFENAGEIFYGKKCQTVIANEVKKAYKKALEDLFH